MGFFQFSILFISYKKSELDRENSRLSGVSYDFLFWFSGFTDAEGNFLITLDRKYVKFRFKI